MKDQFYVVYHKLLLLLGYTVQASSKKLEVEYLLGRDVVIREVYAGTQGKGTRGYVYPQGASKTRVFRFDVRDPSLTPLRSILQKAAQINGHLYADGAYNLKHMFETPKRTVDGVEYVFQLAQIIAFQHGKEEMQPQPSLLALENFAKTRGSHALANLDAKLVNGLRPAKLLEYTQRALIQWMVQINRELWLRNRSQVSNIELLSLSNIPRNRVFFGKHTYLESRFVPNYNEQNLKTLSKEDCLQQFVQAIQHLLRQLRINIQQSRVRVQTMRGAESVQGSFTPSVGRFFFPAPVAMLYSAYHTSTCSEDKYAWGVRCVEGLFQFIYSCLVCEMAALVADDVRYQHLKKVVKNATGHALKPSFGALYTHLTTLVKCRREIDEPHFFPHLEGLIASDVYQNWVGVVKDERNRFAHDDLILSSEQASRRLQELDFERGLRTLLDQVSWLQNYHLGFFQRLVPHQFVPQKAEAHWIPARGILEPGEEVKFTVRLEKGTRLTQMTDGKIVYCWSPHSKKILNLYPYIVQYTYTRSILLWIRRSSPDEERRRFLYRHPIDEFYHTQNYLPTDRESAYTEYRKHIFMAHQIETIEIAEGSFNSNITNEDWGVYSKVRRLGSGGAGEVYQARCFAISKDVALKILYPDLLQDPKMVKQFFREGKLVRLRHNNIVQINGSGFIKGLMYIDMEYIDGLTLSEEIERGIPEETVSDYMGQLLEGMDYVHSQGVYHRDLKPSNVMINRDGVLKIIDFGIAKIVEEDDKTGTLTAQSMGTLRYRDPEAGPKDVHLADIYGLGLLFACMHGHGPTVHGLQVKLPERLAAWQGWYHKATTRREHRFQTVREMKASFEEILRSLGN